MSFVSSQGTRARMSASGRPVDRPLHASADERQAGLVSAFTGAGQAGARTGAASTIPVPRADMAARINLAALSVVLLFVSAIVVGFI